MYKVLITYEELKGIPMSELQDMDISDPGAVTFTKINQNDLSQSFRVEMKADNFWNTHYHDCLETIIVYTGVMYNHSRENIIDRHNPAVIKKYEPHLIEATTDCVFYVEFINPESKLKNERILTA
jgi:hypothetical protein